MKSMTKREVVSMLVSEGFELADSNGHIKYRHPITGIIAMLTHKPVISPGTMREIHRRIKESKAAIRATINK